MFPVHQRSRPENKNNDVNLLGVVIHDDRHTVHVQPVRLGHHPFPEPERDVIRAQQSRDHDEQLGGHDPENGRVPLLQNVLLEPDIRSFTTRQNAPGVTCVGSRSFYERVEVTAALKLVLYPQPSVHAQILTPLQVDLALEIEVAFFVGDVTGNDEKNEADPEEERIPGEEGAVVEKDTRPTYERGENADDRGDGADDEFRMVANADNVGVCQDVEPNEKTSDETSQRVDSELNKSRGGWKSDD